MSYTFKPVDESTHSQWLRSHREAGIVHHAALGEDGRIAGLCVVRADGADLVRLRRHLT